MSILRPGSGQVLRCVVCMNSARPYNRLRMKPYHVAIAGATGAVGAEFFRVLERRGFPIKSLKALSSSRSAGKSLQFKGESIKVEELTDKSFDEIDIAFFS